MAILHDGFHCRDDNSRVVVVILNALIDVIELASVKQPGSDLLCLYAREARRTLGLTQSDCQCDPVFWNEGLLDPWI